MLRASKLNENVCVTWQYVHVTLFLFFSPTRSIVIYHLCFSFFLSFFLFIVSSVRWSTSQPIALAHRMSQLEKKSLINDLLHTIPDHLQMNLLEAISQLTNFLNDAIDFPHKHIPVRCIPSTHADIFYRCITSNTDDNDDGDMAMVARTTTTTTATQPPSNYGPYNREQVITMDLAINPKRYRSWLELLRIKISQFDKLYDAIDLTG